MNKARLAYLLNAYFNKTATAAEVDQFMDAVIRSEHNETLRNLLAELWETHSPSGGPFSENAGKEMLTAILQQGRVMQPAKPARPAQPAQGAKTGKSDTVRYLRWLPAAAVILLFIGGYLYITDKKVSDPVIQTPKQSVPNPILPGGNKAVLILADGSSIELDSTHRGALPKQGNAYVVNLQSSVLTYDAGKEKAQETLYNILSTPRGGQYKLVLADGTKVWLNASSSIRFPVAFNGHTRDVTVTGEAYFEVAKDKRKPFTVNARGVDVQVLGTHFNIMSYDDEHAVTTTLVEGSVKVTKGNQQKILQPGRQLKFKDDGAMKSGFADVEEVLAWKNGWFSFNSWDIERVMRQIARWYDVEVVYEGKIPTGGFSGVVSRDNDINQALDIMRTSGVGFKIEGHKITVYEGHP